MRYLCLAACFALGACVHNRMLPPNVDQGFAAEHFRAFHEPPLWTPGAARGYRSRMRLSTSGILLRNVSVRIDEHAGGRITGHVVVTGPYGSRRREWIEGRDIKVSRPDFDALNLLAQQARLWESERQFWQRSDDEICLDGVEMVFERVDARGYRVGVANSDCTATWQLLRVAGRIFEIAGDAPMRRHFPSRRE